MSVPKNDNRHSVRLAIEGSGYGQGGVIAGTDAFHVHDTPEPDMPWQFDGKRSGRAAGTGGSQRRERPAGRAYLLSLVHRVRPGGAAYSASVFPTVHKLLRAHGMTATGTFGAGTEKWAYAISSDGTSWESLFGDVTRGKELLPFVGGYIRKWTHSAKDLGVPEWAFDLNGISSVLPADQLSLPTTTYPLTTIDHARAAASVLTLQASGGVAFQGRVRESTVTSERTIEERVSQAEAGGAHPGWQLGPYTQTLDMVVEATNLQGSPYTAASQIDPYRLRDEATLLSVVLGFNQSQQYKRYKFESTGFAAQIADVRPEKGTIRRWGLTIDLNPTAETTDDGLSVVFD